MTQLSALARHALKLMESDPDWAEDARQGADVGNTVIGSVMSITTGSPRWATEKAVREALAAMKGKRSRNDSA